MWFPAYYAGYQDVINYFGILETIASKFVMLTYTFQKVLEKFLVWETLEMVSICYDWMYNTSHLGLEGLGRLILIVRYGA